ncbi:MAG TPA: hypothetical protein VF277_06795 [Steroidobacteraceae bacterium]
MRLQGLIILLLVTCTTAAAPPTTEAPLFLQMVAVSPEAGASPPFDQHWSIFLDGIIDDGAPSRLERFLDRRDVAGAVVYLNSPGGSLTAAMELGRILRAAKFEAHVGARAADTGKLVAAVCYGACPFALAGGVKRQLEPGSVLGVHRAENRIPEPDEDAVQRRARFASLNYLAEMGIDAALIDLMETVPYDTIRPLSDDEARRVGLLN